jgi:uncharacterized protein YdaT
MPWTAASFKKKHNHSLSPAQSEKAASMANAILKSGASDKIAIATANKRVASMGKKARKK